MVETVAGVGSTAVSKATGYDWDHWFDHLDTEGATDFEHREIVSLLEAAGVESGWWQQQIAVGYEQERGLREVGETADAGFQVGCQRTLPVAKADLWAWLLSPAGVETWLGEGVEFEGRPGETYSTTDSIRGEVRTRSDEQRLRLTWQPPGWKKPSTLQFTVSCPRNTADRTTLRIHHEHLADPATREAMRTRWQAVLAAIESQVESAKA